MAIWNLERSRCVFALSCPEIVRRVDCREAAGQFVSVIFVPANPPLWVSDSWEEVGLSVIAAGIGEDEVVAAVHGIAGSRDEVVHRRATGNRVLAVEARPR